MPKANVSMNVVKLNDQVSMVQIQGEVSAFAENVMMDAYSEASAGNTQAIILDFSGLEYMNSTGIGLLVTLLIRANRQKQRLLAVGLSEHYQQIFELTRLREAIPTFATVEDAQDEVIMRQ